MNKIEQLKLDMKAWLNLHPDLTVSISECFNIADRLAPWRVRHFYMRFAPNMAKVLDEELESKNEQH